MNIEEDIILIAGPTASGKTRLAIDIASANNAIIINTDSMQVYQDLRIITARPSPEEENAAPHYLFGYRDAAEPFSVAGWLEDVAQLLAQFLSEQRKVVFVGGTGLYFNALTDGLSPMPEIEPAIRKKWREVTLSNEELYQKLFARDPNAAEQLRSSDRQRIVRAMEVFESTGKSILDWQKEAAVSIVPQTAKIRRHLLMPERSVLHQRINLRFDLMIAAGALDEVEALMKRKLPSSLPAMKAIGVPQLSAHLRGEIDLDTAIEAAKAATRQYAKRQSTWFRNSFGENWENVDCTVS